MPVRLVNERFALLTLSVSTKMRGQEEQLFDHRLY